MGSYYIHTFYCNLTRGKLNLLLPLFTVGMYLALCLRRQQVFELHTRVVFDWNEL